MTAAFKRVEQRRLVDGRAARDVDEDAIGAHRLQITSAETIPRVLSPPARRHDQEIRLPGKLDAGPPTKA